MKKALRRKPALPQSFRQPWSLLGILSKVKMVIELRGQITKRGEQHLQEI